MMFMYVYSYHWLCAVSVLYCMCFRRELVLQQNPGCCLDSLRDFCTKFNRITIWYKWSIPWCTSDWILQWAGGPSIHPSIHTLSFPPWNLTFLQLGSWPSVWNVDKLMCCGMSLPNLYTTTICIQCTIQQCFQVSLT